MGSGLPAKSVRIRAALCGHGTRPDGRVWRLGPAAHHASLHIVPGDALIYMAVELPDPLPQGLIVKAYQQTSLDGRTAVAITDALTTPTELTVKASEGGEITVTLSPPPLRRGIDTAWRPEKI